MLPAVRLLLFSPDYHSRLTLELLPLPELLFFLTQQQRLRPQDRSFLFLPEQAVSYLMKPTLAE